MLGATKAERRMQQFFRWIGTALLAALLAAGMARAQDSGPADPLPELRDIGQTLDWQAVAEGPRPASVPLGPMTALGGIADWAHVTGAGSRTWYTRRGTLRQMEAIYRRQRELLESAGFEIRTAGFSADRTGAGVGSNAWIGLYLAANPLPEGAPALQGAEEPAQGALIASREGAEGTLWVVMLVTQPGPQQIGVLLDLTQTLRSDPPPALGLQAMDRAIRRQGRVVLDGLRFDEAGALTPDSEPVLSALAHYLRANQRQEFRLVGHTEERGSLADAARLSQRQAEAVIAALVARHGVQRDSLRAFGLGPLSPLFPNDSEAGRARNRRVELVAGP